MDLADAAKHNRLPNLDAAYVGLVEESGSLFAMSPDRFPLVVFGDADSDSARSRRMLDPPPGTHRQSSKDFPPELDVVKRIAKERIFREACKNGSTDIRCLTGVRKLGSDSQSRISRLLDGAPSVAPPPNRNSNIPGMPPFREAPDIESSLPDGTGNTSISPPLGWDVPQTPPADAHPSRLLLGMSPPSQAFSAFTLCAIMLLVWVSVRKFLGPTAPPSSHAVIVPVSAPATVQHDEKVITNESAPDTSASSSSNGHASAPEAQTPLSEPTPAVTVVFAPEALEPLPASTDNGNDAADGEDTEKEGDVLDTPGKRKGIRRKRGKKKKVNVTIAVPTDEAEQITGEEKPSMHEQPNDVEESPKPIMSSIVLAPAPPVPNVPTLVVSDSVLGA